MSGSTAGDWLDDTYWYVPTMYLPALLAINTSQPRIVTVNDQTVWHFDNYDAGYITGISATNIGFGWSYMLLVGSVTADGSVKFSFSPLGSADPSDPTTQTITITIGDGTLNGTVSAASFLMQMTSGTAGASVTHWANMLPIDASDPQWLALPGYPTTGVPDLTGLQTEIVACFAAGTSIATIDGATLVEDIREGAEVRTFAGGAAVVTWVGRRTVECRHHPNPRAVWPVRIRAGTFAEGCPAHDLWLSPDHAIHVENVLIPVKHLVDGDAICQVAVERITYWHIEVPTHDVILANGLPAESYLDTGNRSAFANGSAGVTLFPDFAPLLWEGRGAFPLVVTGPVLQKVRRRLQRRRATAA